MTGLTQIGDVDMATWQAVATGTGATTQHLIVIDTSRGPTGEWCRRVAGFAYARGSDMPGRLIVTAGTHTKDLVVIHLIGLHNPVNASRSQVTGLAQISDTDVPARQRMATRAGTTAKHLVMVDTGRRPAWER